MVDAVLFDLDGTLIDTAPDMGAALNNLLVEEGFDALPMESIRPHVSKGGLVLTQLGFASRVTADAIEPLRLRFLDHYHANVADQSRLFAGMETVLNQLESTGIPWGIVTNKPEWLTFPLLDQLQLRQRCAVVIGGDTLPKKKPDPLPLSTAAKRLSVSATNCIYVGDDERDVIAGKAAGMATIIAAYGYIEPGTRLDSWQADGIIDSALQLLELPELKDHVATTA